MKRSTSENIWLVIKYVSLIGFTILCIYPLVWLFLSSFKTNAELDTLETQLLLLFLRFWLL